MPTLADLIATSYGYMDNKFAGHDADKERARESIVEAGNQNISFDEFIEMHNKHLTAKGCDSKKIEDELKKVKDLKSYLD